MPDSGSIQWLIRHLQAVDMSKSPTWMAPHIIHLDVAVDNLLYEGQPPLPLAPWH
jgi:hypothetical protein